MVKHVTIITSCNVATPSTITAVKLWFYNESAARINGSAARKDHWYLNDFGDLLNAPP